MRTISEQLSVKRVVLLLVAVATLAFCEATLQVGSIVWAQQTSTYTEFPINIAKAYHEVGNNYIVAQDFGTPADTTQSATSILRIFENGIELAPAHALHNDIRNIGQGRFSHWGGTTGSPSYLYFSTSDNSNPLTNGRRYTYRIYTQSSSATSGSYIESPVNVGKGYHEVGYNYIVMQDFGTPADTTQSATSKLRIFENGVELAPAHALHNDIRNIGQGRFSHWGGTTGSPSYLYFSASDNSNPLTNGRRYTYRIYFQSVTSSTPSAVSTTPTTAPTTSSSPPPPSAPPPPSPPPPAPSAPTAVPLKTDLGVYPEPALPSMGPAGSKVVDPTFGTTIMRLTDANDGASCEVGYSYFPTFNSNTTKAWVLVGNTPLIVSFDPVNFARTGATVLTQPPPVGSLSDIWDAAWSGSDPDLIYIHNRSNRLWSYRLSTATYSLIRDFSPDLGAARWLDQMSKSQDDDLFSFIVSSQQGGTANAGYLVYRRSTNTILKQSPDPTIIEADVEKSGRYFFAATADPAAQFFDTQSLTAPTSVGPTIANGGFWHDDMGHGTIFTAGDDRKEWRYRTLSNPGQWTSILPGYLGITNSEHYSMLADNERWAVISQARPDQGPVQRFGDNEIFQVATDGTNRVRRIAHHRLKVIGYYATKANISRDGQFIAFNSNWGNPNGRHDVYVVRIPPAPPN